MPSGVAAVVSRLTEISSPMDDYEQSPLVDVGIPTYGRPRYLREAIESVLAQTFGRWRLTISDDGNGTARPALAPYLEDPRVTYRHGEGGRGDRRAAAANWSGLVQSASARYVALLHDDDWWAPEFLERRVSFFERHPECGLVYGPQVDVDAGGKEVWRAPHAFPEGVYQPEEFVRRFVREAPLRPSPPSLLVAREAFEAVGPRFDPRFVVFDSEMWLRIALRFPAGYVPQHDSYYRIHGASLSGRSEWGEPWLRWQEHLEQLLDRELPAAAFTASERRVRRASAHLTSALDAVGDGRRGDALSRLGDAIKLERRALRDPRLALALLALPLGRRGGALLRFVRRFVAQRGIRSSLALPH